MEYMIHTEIMRLNLKETLLQKRYLEVNHLFCCYQNIDKINLCTSPF